LRRREVELLKRFCHGRSGLSPYRHIGTKEPMMFFLITRSSTKVIPA
jgi:hypothetical protein